MSRKWSTPELKGAFTRGRNARTHGESFRANPYRPASDGDLWRAWNAGFTHTGTSRQARKRRNQVNAVVALHGDICWLCHRPIGSQERMTLDHVLPKSKGGKRTRDNLRPAHFKCNQRRGNGPPPELLLTPDMMLEPAQ
jgi:5-methylcytosine-specific restriction endonuclease McrA